MARRGVAGKHSRGTPDVRKGSLFHASHRPVQASDDVTEDRLDMRGYIDTARKHGLNALDVLHQLMLGNPWLSPAWPISP